MFSKGKDHIGNRNNFRFIVLPPLKTKEKNWVK